MKIVFLGYAVHPEINQTLSGNSVAGNKMELSILRELKRNGLDVNSITVWPIAAFPREKSLFIKREKMDIGEGMVTDRIGFINIPGIKQLTQIHAVYKSAERIVYKHPDAVVVPFNMYPQVGIPAIRLKKKYGCKIVPILADLPIDDDYKRKGINKWIRQRFNEKTKQCIKDADEVIALNKHARDVYASGKRYLVVDGGIDVPPQEADEKIDIWDDGKKHILYTGSLQEYSGIAEMVKAMKYVENPNIILDIYGSGSLEKWISSIEEKNVCFHGITDNKTVMKLQRNAWLLVNPRPIDDEIAKVTFPSKIFEYMLSGTPVLATRLNGFTEEYEDKLIFVDDNTPEHLAEVVNRIDRMPDDELINVAKRAYEFVRTRKTWEYQGERIADFLLNGV